jgi:hypothetical protein
MPPQVFYLLVLATSSQCGEANKAGTDAHEVLSQ